MFLAIEDYEMNIILLLSIIVLVSILIFVLYSILKNPFKYPYYYHSFDVTGKRNVDINDLMDNFFIDGGFNEIKNHEERITGWRNKCNNKINKSKLKKYRNNQYNKVLDDKKAYVFYITRKITKYKQHNYVREKYKEPVTQEKWFCSYETLNNRNNELKKINYQTTLKKYNSKNQRKLLTKKLKDEIKQRDNYTCQLCGKYMPDEIGLQIDHIIPIANGGKTIKSNLQVLCSRCNLQKSTK